MNDLVNGLFELLGAALLTHNCWLLYCHKQVQGVSVFTTAFFTVWGFWNLYFYPANHLWLSFAGGLLLASTNLVWVSMAVYYGRTRFLGRPSTVAVTHTQDELEISVSPHQHGFGSYRITGTKAQVPDGTLLSPSPRRQVARPRRPTSSLPYRVVKF